MQYRNVNTGRIIERPSEDRWLEASAGWERVEPAAASGEDEERTED